MVSWLVLKKVAEMILRDPGLMHVLKKRMLEFCLTQLSRFSTLMFYFLSNKSTIEIPSEFSCWAAFCGWDLMLCHNH